MKTVKFLFISFFSISLVVACNNTAKQAAPENKIDTADKNSAAPSRGIEKTITAKFIAFELGDASHFLFEDESGKSWDFGGNDDKKFTFEEELPADKANTNNQGYTSNKALQGKWFIISYDIKNQPIYPDGPTGEVLVISR